MAPSRIRGGLDDTRSEASYSARDKQQQMLTAPVSTGISKGRRTVSSLVTATNTMREVASASGLNGAHGTVPLTEGVSSSETAAGVSLNPSVLFYHDLRRFLSTGTDGIT